MSSTRSALLPLLTAQSCNRILQSLYPGHPLRLGLTHKARREATEVLLSEV
jgi:hypothetical protein